MPDAVMSKKTAFDIQGNSYSNQDQKSVLLISYLTGKIIVNKIQ